MSVSNAQQFCTFYVDRQFFGVPVQQVQGVIRYQEMTRVPLVPRVIRGLINLRGQIVVAIDLRRRLNAPERPEDQLPMNVVVGTADGALSLLVDEIGDVLEVQEETFERPPETLQGIARELVWPALHRSRRARPVISPFLCGVGRAQAVERPAVDSRHRKSGERRRDGHAPRGGGGMSAHRATNFAVKEHALRAGAEERNCYGS
jgi:purine-binding chemotaxis protein CheW